MADKKELTAEEIYKKNQKKSKVLKILAPVCFWGFLALSLVCLILAFKNSFGNIAEIIRLLDGDVYNGEELKANYLYLIGKYGEWVIGGASGGFTITFVNIGKALFSGLAITNCVLCVFFILCAYILGKWVLPKISTQLITDNQDMVNMTILKQKDKE